jgi:hypothetical protein
MKTCKDCGVTAPKNTFPQRSARCKLCHNIYTRKHYQENKKYYADKRIRQVAKVNEWVRKYKTDNPCTDCGKFFHYCQMDFDHLDDKEFSVAMIKSSIARVKKEIAKCELVCSNCHRLRTFSRQ